MSRDEDGATCPRPCHRRVAQKMDDALRTKRHAAVCACVLVDRGQSAIETGRGGTVGWVLGAGSSVIQERRTGGAQHETRREAAELVGCVGVAA